MSAGDSPIEITDVTFRWSDDGQFRLQIPEFYISRGEAVLLLGESGSGKSTLLSLICGVISADKGRVQIEGADIGTMRQSQRDRFRAKNIGVIFQQFNLLPFATVADNILLPLRFAPERAERVTDPSTEATRLCRTLALENGIEHRKAADLSVGQQQRVAVARALIGSPPIVVADEPTSALDSRSRDRFMDTLFGQVAAQSATLLMVSHDESLGHRFDRTLHIRDVVGSLGAAPC